MRAHEFPDRKNGVGSMDALSIMHGNMVGRRLRRFSIVSALLTSFLLTGDSPGQENPYLFLQLAEQAARASNHSDALRHLEEAFEAGYQTPEKVLSTSTFRRLREAPPFRQKLRELLKKHLRASDVTMIDPEEEGERMVISGSIVRPDGTPVAGAIVFLYHTDHEGLYAPEHLRAGYGANNPRLFAYVKSDDKGEFTVTTIRPNSYPGYRNLRHIHFEITAPGCNQISQFYLDSDPEPTPTQITNANERNFPILTATQDAKGEFRVRFVRTCR